MHIEEFLDLVDGKPVGEGYMCFCPAHDDNNPSLSINEGDDGRILLHCFAGCETEDVLKALGLKWADLFPQEGRSKK